MNDPIKDELSLTLKEAKEARETVEFFEDCVSSIDANIYRQHNDLKLLGHLLAEVCDHLMKTPTPENLQMAQHISQVAQEAFSGPSFSPPTPPPHLAKLFDFNSPPNE